MPETEIFATVIDCTPSEDKDKISCSFVREGKVVADVEDIESLVINGRVTFVREEALMSFLFPGDGKICRVVERHPHEWECGETLPGHLTGRPGRTGNPGRY